MMIHKLTLDEMTKTVQLPYALDFLSVGEQDGMVVCWYQFDDTTEKKWKFTLTVVGTGQPHASDIGGHIGTVQMKSGLVWHVFTRRWAL